VNQSGLIHITWENFQSGNKEAFAHIYTIYLNPLYFYGTKLCNDEDMVKDAIQEVFLDLYLKREKNKTNPENLKFYLILALKRNLIRKLKKNRKLLRYNSPTELMFEPEYCVEKKIIEQETDNEVSLGVYNALKKLPAKQKEAIYLRFNESLEYNDIAELLNISVESVRKQVYRALKKIRESFGEKTWLFWLTISRKK
jgi:RNA polymerase sigma factor (sigma-70 family)